MSSLSENLLENMALRSQMNKKKTTSSSSSSSSSPKKPSPTKKPAKKKSGLMSKIFGKKSEDLNLSERLLLALGETNILESVEGSLKSKYPKAFAKIKSSLTGPEDTIEDASILSTSDGKKAIYVETEGHGYLFDTDGKEIGEEDGGFDDPAWKEYNKELKTIFKSKKSI